MTHPLSVKAQAMAMLMTGDAVVYVAKTLGVPKQTVSRWKGDSDRLFREIVRSSPELRAIAAAIREVLPGLHRQRVYGQNGTKKRAREVGGLDTQKGAARIPHEGRDTP